MTQLIIVCPAALQDAANQAALQFDPLGGLNTFNVGLNASGSVDDPVTHYWCAFRTSGDTLAAILAAAAQLGVTVYQDVAPQQVLATEGLQPVAPPRP
jgi:endoglucanase Acf2